MIYAVRMGQQLEKKRRTIPEEVKQEAIELRKSGMSFVKIGEKLQISANAAFRFNTEKKENDKPKKELTLNQTESDLKAIAEKNNYDRHLCKKCKWKAGRHSINGCDYIMHFHKSRRCTVAECDKYEKGKRVKPSGMPSTVVM